MLSSRREDQSIRSNVRVVFLLSVLGSIFDKMILERMYGCKDNSLRDYNGESGRRGDCADKIRLLVEKSVDL